MHATISRLLSCSQRQQFRSKSSSSICRLDVMSEVEDNLPRDEQSHRRVWEWIQSQNDDKSEEQESEPHTGRKRKDPPDPNRSGEEESRTLAHGASDERDSDSNGGDLLAWAEPANPGDSPLPLGRQPLQADPHYIIIYAI